MIKQATTPELAFLERFDPLERMGWTRSTFQERFRGVAKSETITAAPAFVIKSKDFDEPRSPERAPCKLLPRVEESDVFPANLVLLWRGKLVWKN